MLDDRRDHRAVDVLADRADGTREVRELGLEGVSAVDADLAVKVAAEVVRDDAVDAVSKRRLARAALADDADEVAVFDGQRHPVERLAGAGAVGEAYMLNLDHGVANRAVSDLDAPVPSRT